MGSLFSSSSKESKTKSTTAASSNVSSKDRAVLDLKNAKDRLKKYKKKVRRSNKLDTRQLCIYVSYITCCTKLMYLCSWSKIL